MEEKKTKVVLLRGLRVKVDEKADCKTYAKGAVLEIASRHATELIAANKAAVFTESEKPKADQPKAEKK